MRYQIVDGELYIWGKNSNGQLGLGKKAAKVVPALTKIELFILGWVGKAKDILYEGEVLSWGGGGSGRLGHGHESSILGFLSSSRNSLFPFSYELIDTFCTVNTHPRLIKEFEKVKVKNAAAGLLHSACIDEKGCVFIFGEGAADKMVFQDRKNATTPSMISKLPYSDEVACGGYHTEKLQELMKYGLCD
ncbi:hypothetical protein Patl1_28034 [Pistacia atlantica]|uniref:Uncharacterized protein n=1 Tax=Pistacia atlantica TaxID=434234 RepID=A0ACC1BC85_9ROSI|nr:hypothetical protein Patl1_28034 [Pistacia atlantica]